MPRKKYRIFLVLVGILILGPVLSGLILLMPHFLYPNDCNVSARCNHQIVEVANSMYLGLIFLGPAVMLLGALLLVLVSAAYGLSVVKARDESGLPQKRLRLVSGIFCSGILLYLGYIPGGPDECSRVFTDTQYETCVEGIFAGMTVSQARSWLENNGYRLSETRDVSSYGQTFRRPGKEFQYQIYFQAIRDHGRWSSVPYGTNFNRFFARLWPAPGNFELNLFGQQSTDVIAGIKVEWSFSFL